MLVYEHVTCEIMIRIRKLQVTFFLVCFTQDDYVMLISHTKGYNERKFSSYHKELMIIFIQGVNLLLPMISYDERKLNGYSRKGVKLSIEV